MEMQIAAKLQKQGGERGWVGMVWGGHAAAGHEQVSPIYRGHGAE